jgi:hypothetical protein
LGVLIVAASRAIDLFCRRRFYEYEETRLYGIQTLRTKQPMRQGEWLYPWSNTMHTLRLDADLISVENFLNADSSIIAPEDYLLYPLNGPPYRSIDIRSVQLMTYTSPLATYGVEGTWGFLTRESEEIIPLACMMWAAQMMEKADNPGVQSTSIGGFSVSFASNGQAESAGQSQPQLRPPPEISQLLEGFRFRDIATSLF